MKSGFLISFIVDKKGFDEKNPDCKIYNFCLIHSEVYTENLIFESFINSIIELNDKCVLIAYLEEELFNNKNFKFLLNRYFNEDKYYPTIVSNDKITFDGDKDYNLLELDYNISIEELYVNNNNDK